MITLWTRRFFLTSLFAMVGSLYIAVGATYATTEQTVEAAKPEAPKEEAKPEGIEVSDAEHLKKVLEENDFNLDKTLEDEQQVPRTFIANFPQDMRQVKNRKTKKDLFVQVMLPMILHENEIIKQERKHIIELKKAVDSGKELKHSDRFWLNKVCDKYKMKSLNFEELLRRVDIIPPSLALGQATIESGMGISYAALKKNSPFGMMARSNKVKAYKSLSESISGYICNLNYNPAYKSMRKTREELRKANKEIDGSVLIGDMLAYCEFGKPYIKDVRSAIKSNDFIKYDNLSLEPKEKV